jgi:hypothetical protein
MFNATFNNISAISWQSVLLVEETGVPGENHQPVNVQLYSWDRRYRDLMVVGCTTTYAISAYHHWCCEFESRSRRGAQHYVIKFVSDLRQVGGFLRVQCSLVACCTANNTPVCIVSPLSLWQSTRLSDKINPSITCYLHDFTNICCL